MATIRDIAARAGVSVATVSHVINQTRFVSKELTARVKDAMEECNYYPNLVAGSLRKRKTGTIGIITPDNCNLYYAELVRTLDTLLFSQGYNIITCNSAYELVKEVGYLDLLISRRVDGVIIVPTSNSAETLEKVQRRQIPVVVLDRKIENVAADMVLVDNVKGGYLATEHLLKLGHRTIGYIDRSIEQSHSLNRRAGYLRALRDYGVRVNKSLIVKGGFTYREGLECAKRLMQNVQRPTAIFTYNDVTAIGAICGVQQAGMRVPEDISVVGCDNIALDEYFIPSITTIYYPIAEIAENASELILERIRNHEDRPPQTAMLSPRLLVRDSTSPVSRGERVNVRGTELLAVRTGSRNKSE